MSSWEHSSALSSSKKEEVFREEVASVGCKGDSCRSKVEMSEHMAEQEGRLWLLLAMCR